MENRKLTRRHWNLLLAGIGAGVLALILYIFAKQGVGIPCLFNRITGYLCPGCGNSRAVLALLRLDILSALEYNLLFPFEFFYLGWVLLHCSRAYLQGKAFSYWPPCPWLDVVILIAVLLWWLLRNIL